MIDDSTDGDPVEEIADAWAKVYIDVADKLDGDEHTRNQPLPETEDTRAEPT